MQKRMGRRERGERRAESENSEAIGKRCEEKKKLGEPAKNSRRHQNIRRILSHVKQGLVQAQQLHNSIAQDMFVISGDARFVAIGEMSMAASNS